MREVCEWSEQTGATVYKIRQKACYLDVLVLMTGNRQVTQEIRQRYRQRSARICKVCGGPAVPVEQRIPRPTRTHCGRCEQRWKELGEKRALWMEHARIWLPEWRV